VLTFETRDRDHEPRTYCAESNPKKNKEKFSIKRIFRYET
jgi:hypothetical protein